MTAEERFQRMIDECDAKHGTGPEAPCEACGVAALRSAEDDALERAARILEGNANAASGGVDTRALYARSAILCAAAAVRSLKSGGSR